MMLIFYFEIPKWQSNYSYYFLSGDFSAASSALTIYKDLDSQIDQEYAQIERPTAIEE